MRAGDYDYFDFGCSTGGSIAFVQTVFPSMRGLGIDTSPAKVEAARKAGHDAITLDLLTLPDRPLVRFVTMMHFLEHLPGRGDAQRMVAKAIRVSTHFVFIRQPWFDSDGALLERGLKLYWSDWRGHPNKMTSLDFHSILSPELEAGRIRGFSILGRRSIADSGHPALLPVSAPIDQHRYDPGSHGPKPEFPLPFRAFAEIVVRIDIGEGLSADPIMERMKPLEPLVDSRGSAGAP